jgi:16S rRNA (adenine(1408)-N(1))-methyltransferase
VGAGDGLASLRLARADPGVLAVAIDPSIDRLRVGARSALRQKLPNVLFAVARIEDAPRELDGAADRITVSFPWGSLLRGIVRAEPSVLAPLARIAKPASCVDVLLSVESRDAASGLDPGEIPALPTRADAFTRHGLVIERLATAAEHEVAASGSSWAKRLGRSRRASALRLRRLVD